MKLHIGLDDTDSDKGGCTTYIASLLIEKLLTIGAEFLDYPILLRLNPNTPWKTRGNASICLRVNVNEANISQIYSFSHGLIEQYGELWCDNTNPGVVFLKGEVPDIIERFSDKVVHQLVEINEALNLHEEYGIETISYKNKRGLIGATAAVGGMLKKDHTFELITYRKKNNWGTERKIDFDSVLKMDKRLKELTFNNIDHKRKSLITPHGPDPVLYGIRGETPQAVYLGHNMISVSEPIESWIIYRTNQGTDAHFTSPIKIKDLQEYNPAIIQGKIVSTPITIRGGHVILRLGDNTGEVDCAFYEPTGSLRHIVWKLIENDELKVYGGVKIINGKFTINVEKLEVQKLVQKYIIKNPKCPECGKSTESMGKRKGFRCKKCGYRNSSLSKKVILKDRGINEKIYLPDRNAQRHLTKPLKRYGKEKKFVNSSFFEPWNSF